MPFGETFLYNASKLIDVKSVDADFKFIRELVKKAVAKMKYIKPENVAVYMHGSYANSTNIFFPSNLEVCVELKVPKYEYEMSKDYYVTHKLDYGPKQFRKDLLENLSLVVAKSTKQRAKIEALQCRLEDKCIIVPKHAELKHTVEILPSVTFVLAEKDGVVFNGVLLYSEKVDAEIATFPKLHQKNGQAKDVRTDGNFRRIVRLLKTLNAIDKRENDDELTRSYARGYFIECLLFNVPDKLFLGNNANDVFLKVINYLSNTSLKNFVCQNLVWHLFGNAIEFWEEKAARNFINTVIRMYNEIPEDRTTLA